MNRMSLGLMACGSRSTFVSATRTGEPLTASRSAREKPASKSLASITFKHSVGRFLSSWLTCSIDRVGGGWCLRLRVVRQRADARRIGQQEGCRSHQAPPAARNMDAACWRRIGN